MEEAEIYYHEAINTHKWGRKSYKPDVHYAFKSATSEDEWAEVEKEKDESKKYQDEIKALTAKLKEYTTPYTSRWSGPNEVNHDKKYAWKRIPPKDIKDILLVPIPLAMDSTLTKGMQDTTTR